MPAPAYTIFPLGDAAITVHFGNRIEASLNQHALHLGKRMQAAGIAGVHDVVPAYSSLTVHYHIEQVIQQHPYQSAFETIKQKLVNLLEQPLAPEAESGKILRIPVCYAEKYAPDAAGMEEITQLPFSEIVRIHTSTTYRVYMIGFMPGFAYLGEVDGRIAAPRKRKPALHIAAGSVGIAGRQTGIYPMVSPGGWQIIGRTPICMFHKHSPEPVPVAAGDEVTFYPIGEDEFDNY